MRDHAGGFPVAGQHDFRGGRAARRQFGREPDPATVRRHARLDGGRSDWLPIRVRSYPRRDGGVLRLDVSLPPGSDKGPRILRRVLRRLGARSYPQWRAWLALAYLWDRSAVNGHWVRATRPRLARDSAGRLNLARDWGSFMKALAVVDRIRWLLFR